MAAPGNFAADKARVLSQVDLSRKGSVDAAIVPLLDCVNAQDCFYSTSSCAGRLVLFAEGRGQRKKGCHWLLVSHDPLDPSQLEEALAQERLGEEGYVYFKFEPFVLHAMCSTLSAAKLMLQTAVSAGFRNSGMSCGRRCRWMVAVRSTHSLETPLAHDRSLLTSAEYRRQVVAIGNTKLCDNLQRVEWFHQGLRAAIENTIILKTTPVPPAVVTHPRPDKEARSCVETELSAGDMDSDATSDIASLFS